jgi:hypothetical protein
MSYARLFMRISIRLPLPEMLFIFADDQFSMFLQGREVVT